MKYIILKNKIGKRTGHALVDDDFSDENKFHLGTNGYAVCTKHVYLHHCVLPQKEGYVVDHINQNRLDNRRSNLRYVTHANNLRNNKALGVYWHKVAKKWAAYAWDGKKMLYGGLHESFEEARKSRLKLTKSLKT